MFMSKKEVHKLNSTISALNISPMNITNPNLISYLNFEQNVGYTFRILKDVAILFLVILQNCAYTPLWLYFLSGYTS